MHHQRCAARVQAGALAADFHVPQLRLRFRLRRRLHLLHARKRRKFDALSRGIISEWTNPMQEAWVYSHDGPIWGVKCILAVIGTGGP
eukprot:532908-Pyramimonas_sp.AAC.1